MSAKAKPACASAFSMMSKTAPACAATSSGWRERPSGPASVVPRPSTRRPRRSLDCRKRSPPTARRTRSAADPRPSSAPGGHAAPFEDDGVRRDLEEQAGEHRRPRHDRIDLEVLRRSVVVAATGPRPSRDGTPMPAVVFASLAPPVGPSFTLNPRRSATDFVCSASRAVWSSLLHRPPRELSCHVGRRVRDFGRGHQLADRRDGRVEALAGDRPRPRPRARIDPGRRWVACRR